MSSAMEAVARELLRIVPPTRALVAIDGVDGSGKTTFAKNLAIWLRSRPVVILHADGFLNPSLVRHAKGRNSSEGFWLDSYDYEALCSYVLDPLGPNGDGRYRSHSYDVEADRVVEPRVQQAPIDALIVLEGLFLHRDELFRRWDASIFLDVPFAETARRMALRDGTHSDPEDPSMRRYVGGQGIYFARARPWERASLVVDNTDFAKPRLIAAAHVTSLGPGDDEGAEPCGSTPSRWFRYEN